MTNRCINGDSTQNETWVKALNGRKADALISDPPYCLLTRRRKDGDLRDPKNKKIDRGPVKRFENVREFRDFTKSWLQVAVQHLTPDAPIVLWMNLLGREPMTAACRELGYTHVRGEFVWGKRTREGNSGEEILRVVETALVYSRQPAPVVNNESAALPWSAVAGYDDDGEAERWGSHPNHKPFGVIDPLMRTWSNAGQLVVDPFAGSGSIPAAALKLGREIACIELETEWAERVSERLASPHR